MNIRKDHQLSKGQWFAEVQTKKWIVWHGTQGRSSQTPSNGKPGDATSSIDGWNADEQHIGTPYLIDRDGTIFQTFEDEREWIFHLGLQDTKGKYDKASIGIEFANELELISSGGKFYAFDRVSPNTEYVGPRFQRTWRAHDWWARLDEAQVDAAIELTLQLCVKHNIPKAFYHPSTTYDYPNCFEVAGILCHSNCRKDKSDLILEDWVLAKLQAAGFQFVGGSNPAPVISGSVAAAPPAPSAPPSTATGAGGSDAYTLRSALLAADPALAAIAAGDVVLHPPNPSSRVPGIGTIQRAINRLAKAAGQPEPIDLGDNDKNLEFFGPQTRRAIEDVQRRAGVRVDGIVGDDTLKALDAALVSAGDGGTSAGPAEQPAASPAAVNKPAAGAPVPAGSFAKTLAKVLNRSGGRLPGFLQELVAWGRTAPEEIFLEKETKEPDVYASVKPELGPFKDLLHRKACMLEVMRVLAGFESSWDWEEGIDTSRKSANTAKNSEAGAWQVSSDSLPFGQDLKDLVKREVGTLDGVEFQRAMKAKHPLAMEYVARLMRHTMRHNGPLHRDRSKFQGRLRKQEESIYPWLSRDAVAEFQKLLV